MKTTRKLGSDVRIRTPVLLPCSCPFVMMVVTVGVQDIQYIGSSVGIISGRSSCRAIRARG